MTEKIEKLIKARKNTSDKIIRSVPNREDYDFFFQCIDIIPELESLLEENQMLRTNIQRLVAENKAYYEKLNK